MRKPMRYAKSSGSAVCSLPDGRTVVVPIAPGILKHPAESALPEILRAPDALRKYTIEALRRAPWQVLREFPSDWLMECLDEAALRPGRRAALLYLLAARGPDAPRG